MVARRTVRVTVEEIVRETEAALLVLTLGGEEVWVPFSEVSAVHRSENPPVIVISEWIAIKKGLIE